MRMQIEMALVSDAEDILTLQKLAYRSEAEIYGDDKIEPLVQTIESLKNQFKNHTVLKAIHEGTIIGSVRAAVSGETCLIGKLIVHPEYQGRGIGTALMETIESLHPVRRYELFTGSKSEMNIRLYRRLGYETFKTERIDDHLSLVFLEKSHSVKAKGK